jgi:predicted lipoprotein with Yx(FWY)xxD motif
MKRIGLFVLVPAMFAMACSGGTATQAPTQAPTQAATDANSSPATAQLADSDLGEILVDSEGMTLYGFVPDESTGQPTCYDDCAEAWPPLIVDSEFTVAEGLDMAAFSTAERTDGAGTQLILGTYPLYYFANDEAPGDVNGQGLNEVWYVIGADGELIVE